MHAALTCLAEPFPARLRRHWAELFVLAWPVILSRAGLVVLSLVSIILVGRYGTLELTHLAMGLAIFMPVMVTGIGAMVGVVALTARHTGEGRPDLAAQTLRRGLAWALVVGVVCTILAWFAETWLLLIGQTPALAAGGGSVARWLAPGAGLQIIFVAGTFYLEGTRRMLPGLVLMALANVVNAVLCAWLIWGGAGLPAMGAEGAALASTLARAVMAGGMLLYLARLPELRSRRPAGFWGPGGWAAGADLRRIGLASGAAYFFETVAFAGLNQVAGLISVEALAAYSIAHQIEAMIFMIALGLSVAAAVRVGIAAGAGQIGEARFAGWSALAATMGIIALCAGLVIAAGAALAGVFSTDPAMIARVTPLFAILAVSLIFDAGQVVMGQCNRALGDSWGTTLRFFAAFWLLMLPLGTWLGLATPLAERGLFIATALGCLLAVVLLALRFRSLLARIEG